MILFTIFGNLSIFLYRDLSFVGKDIMPAVFFLGGYFSSVALIGYFELIVDDLEFLNKE